MLLKVKSFIHMQYIVFPINKETFSDRYIYIKINALKKIFWNKTVLECNNMPLKSYGSFPISLNVIPSSINRRGSLHLNEKVWDVLVQY
jgi:hypothetical protein